MIWQKFPVWKGCLYIISQIFGSFMAGLVLMGCYWPEISALKAANIEQHGTAVFNGGAASVLCSFPNADQTNQGYLFFQEFVVCAFVGLVIWSCLGMYGIVEQNVANHVQIMPIHSSVHRVCHLRSVLHIQQWSLVLLATPSVRIWQETLVPESLQQSFSAVKHSPLTMAIHGSAFWSIFRLQSLQRHFMSFSFETACKELPKVPLNMRMVKKDLLDI